MTRKTKKIIEKSIILSAPLFTLIMYLLPWVAFYKERATFTDEYRVLYSYFELLKFDVNLFTTIIMWVSLIGVVASGIINILSLILKEKEKLFTRIGLITVVVSSGILFLTTFSQNIGTEILSGIEVYRWVDFMTIPYALLITYNVASLIYFIKNEKKQPQIEVVDSK